MSYLKAAIHIQFTKRNYIFFGLAFALTLLWVWTFADGLQDIPETFMMSPVQQSIEKAIGFSFYAFLFSIWIVYEQGALFRNGLVKQLMLVGYSRKGLFLFFLNNLLFKALIVWFLLVLLILGVNIIYFPDTFNIAPLWNIDLLLQIPVILYSGLFALFLAVIFKSYFGLIFLLVYGFLEEMIMRLVQKHFEVDLLEWLPKTLPGYLLRGDAVTFVNYLTFAGYFLLFLVLSYTVLKRSRFC